MSSLYITTWYCPSLMDIAHLMTKTLFAEESMEITALRGNLGYSVVTRTKAPITCEHRSIAKRSEVRFDN